MKIQEKIIVAGAGGHGKVVIDLIRSMGQYAIAGVLDPQFAKGTDILGVTVLGGDELLPQLIKEGISNAAVGVGSWGDNGIRNKIFNRLKELGFKVPALVHKNTSVSTHVAVGEGTQIMAGVVIQPDVVIGQNTVINTGSVIEHDCRIGDGVYTGSGVICSGFVTIGNNCFIGSGVTIIPQVSIERGSFVAAGAVVVDNILESQKVKGVPAKVYL